MKFYVAALAGFLALAGTGATAQAAPAFGSAKGTFSGQTLVEKTHGIHRTCQLGRWGWHRSNRWSRISCTPSWRLNKYRHHKNRWNRHH